MIKPFVYSFVLLPIIYDEIFCSPQHTRLDSTETSVDFKLDLGPWAQSDFLDA